MTLAALIAAYHEADEPGGTLRATLPIAGRTLLERQARLAASAGADPVVVVIERVTASLAEAVDRLRSEGVEVVLARNAEQAAAAIHPESRLLLVADGLLAPEAALARLIAIDGPAILTVADTRVDDRYERIDAYSRWAGLAMVDGQLLRDTAAMLQDWDLQSTLLRRAVQSGARQIAVRAEAEDPLPLVAESGEDLAEVEEQIVSGAHLHRADWVSRYFLGSLEQAATRTLMPTAITPTAVGLGSVLLIAFAGLAFFSRWPVAGVAFLLLATPLDGIRERLAALRLQAERGRSWWSALMPLLFAAALVALASSLAPTRGWGCVALAGTIIAFIIALRVEAAGRTVPASEWLAEPKGMAWLMLPFAVTSLWGTGLTILAAYAAGSFFWAQRHAHAAPSPPRQD